MLAAVAAVLALPAAAAEWVSLGPDGGDVRSLAYDPQNPDHILLGTSAGKIFVSDDGGVTWTRMVRLGAGEDYVLDHIVFDPANSKRVFVAAWSVEGAGGAVFRTDDGGRTWTSLPGMYGASVRALAISQSSPETLVAGALDGVFRTDDGGQTWRRISPEASSEIKDVESVAIDPKDPNIIYAGTWHLPWKTIDGGLSWHNIKQGVIDDSDVFSIIVSASDNETIYASACSGIYKSDNAGEQFHKAQGIPYSARRTRMLKQDPKDPQIVYAGTTEGLWRTQDGGKTWARLTGANLIINDILIDSRNPRRVLLATDRSGVLLSTDGAQTFAASNTGFAHRQVAALLGDGSESGTLYAGVLNDKEFGGVFVTHDAGAHWSQISTGLQGRDVFALLALPDATLVAGTNGGVFVQGKNGRWEARNRIVIEPGTHEAKLEVRKPVSLSSVRVAELGVSNGKWFAATSAGLYWSDDQGMSWHAAPTEGERDFISLAVLDNMIFATTFNAVVGSMDSGKTWQLVSVPDEVRRVDKIAIDGDQAVWLATREGAFRSRDGGSTWQHILGGLPPYRVNAISWDEDGRRLLASSGVSGKVYQSTNGGRSWQEIAELPYTLRDVSGFGGRLFVATAFDGILAQPPRSLRTETPTATSTSSGDTQ